MSEEVPAAINDSFGLTSEIKISIGTIVICNE